jgi:predicted transcriptional regulator
MSGKSYFLIERRTRKLRLLDMIKKNPELEIGKLKGLFSLESGVSFKKIDEYLSEMEESGMIKYDAEGKLAIST